MTILAGYLGAGKTTLLNALLRESHEPLGVIINDFGSVNIDASLVAGHTALDGEVALHNGCICCTIRGDLLAALLRLRQRPRPPGHIIIEASGVSDPASIVRTFTDPRIADHVELAAVVGCVDPTSWSTLVGEDLQVATTQLRVCDIIVSTRQDIVEPQQLAATHELLETAAPRARVVSSSLQQAPVALILGAPKLWDDARLAAIRPGHAPHVHEVGHAHGHHHHGHAFETWTFDEDAPLCVYALRRTLGRLPPSVLRAKGFVHVAQDPEARLLVQIVGARAALHCAGSWAEPPRSQLVFLGHEGQLDRVELERLLQACRSDGRPSPGLHMEELVGYFNRLLRGAPGRLH